MVRKKEVIVPRGKSEGQQAIEAAVRELFDAYDVDESGEVNKDEFFKIEMRICFEQGEVFDEKTEQAKMTLQDSDHSGSVTFEEFKDRHIRSLTQQGFSVKEIVEKLHANAEAALAERRRMGPSWHAGVRQCLKRIFALYDTSGDGALSPEEWISSQKQVARELSDDIDESWIDEGAFAAADANGDGVIQYDEFLVANFSMFEGLKQSSEAIHASLMKIVKVLESRQQDRPRQPVALAVQTDAKPPFMPPHESWQDEPTGDSTALTGKWEEKDNITLDPDFKTADEIAGLVRMHLQLNKDTWVSLYYRAPLQSEGAPIRLIKDNNVEDAVDYLSKPNAIRRIFVKNIRAAPTRLSFTPQIWGDEREALMEKRKGQCWGFDWETQIKGDGFSMPPMPMVINAGDAIVVEVPATDENGQYTYTSRAFMDHPDICGGPVEETIQPKAPKKKKKKGADVPAPDPNLQFSFIGIKEGTCTFFVDVCWEEEEPSLASHHNLSQPVQENSIARIGPIQVNVQTGVTKDTTFMWWNGEKWTNKKGPAKKKGKKK